MKNLKKTWTTISSKQVYGFDKIALCGSNNVVMEKEDY